MLDRRPAGHDASYVHMPAVIRIHIDRISADLAAGRLADEGIPAQVVDSDTVGIIGAPTRFSIVVPSHLEAKARKLLREMDRAR